MNSNLSQVESTVTKCKNPFDENSNLSQVESTGTKCKNPFDENSSVLIISFSSFKLCKHV